MKAIIIGGGIAGLAAARGLQLTDWDLSLYEQAPAYKAAGAGIVLSPNALKALEALGLYEAVEEAGHPVEFVTVRTEKGIILSNTWLKSTGIGFGKQGSLTLHRAELHSALLSQLPSLPIQMGKKCKNIRQDQAGTEVEFEDGELASADILLGCDGIHSAVRKSIFPGTEKRYSGYTCWRGVASARPKSHPASLVTETWGRGRRFGIVPLSNNRVYWFACLNAPKANDPEMEKMSLQDLKEVFKNFQDPVEEILDHTPEQFIFRNDIMDLKPIPSFTKGRVVLPGDAGHAPTPNMGQGGCQALEDAAVLAALLQQYDYKTAFSEYNRLRIPRTHKIVNQSWTMGKVAQWENPLAVAFRNALFRSIPASVNERQLKSLFSAEFKKVTGAEAEVH